MQGDGIKPEQGDDNEEEVDVESKQGDGKEEEVDP